jgi:hypothetical protein
MANLETWTHIAGIIESVAVTAGVVITVATLNTWKKQEVGKRRIEVAEGTMLAFHELAESIHFVRSRLEVREDETPLQAFERHRSEYYNRTIQSVALDNGVNGLAGLEPVFRVYFGRESTRPMEALIKAARTLALDTREMFTNVPAENRELKDKSLLLDRIGWGTTHRPDALDKIVHQAVSDMTALCDPILAGKR